MNWIVLLASVPASAIPAPVPDNAEWFREAVQRALEEQMAPIFVKGEPEFYDVTQGQRHRFENECDGGDTPYRQLYASFEAYMEAMGYLFDEQKGTYGVYSDPLEQQNWWMIGGNYSGRFLIAEDEQQAASDDYWHEPPAGYRWTCAARKSAIRWDLMYEFEQGLAKQRFAELKAEYGNSVAQRNPKEDGVYSDFPYINQLVYRWGETEEQYLERIGLGKDGWRASTYQFISDGVLYSSSDPKWFRADGQTSDAFMAMVWQFIDGLEDDDVLASIDCRM